MPRMSKGGRQRRKEARAGLLRGRESCYYAWFPAPKTPPPHAYRPSQRKRAVRRRASPLQAGRREDGPPHRAPCPRVLRKADRRAQAQACRGREAPLQAHARADAAAEAVLSSVASIRIAASRAHAPLAAAFGVAP